VDNGITYYSDDLNSEFDALQITLAQSMWKGIAANINYQWASAFDEQGGYSTGARRRFTDATATHATSNS